MQETQRRSDGIEVFGWREIHEKLDTIFSLF